MHKDRFFRSSSVILSIGIVALIAGLYLNFTSGSVPLADQLRCENIVNTSYSGSQDAKDTLLPKCNEPGMVAMMDAKANNASGEQAAKAIASANNADTGYSSLSFALIGIGIVLLIGGAARILRPTKTTK